MSPLWLPGLALGMAAAGDASALAPPMGYEAEAQKTSGTLVGPDRRLGTLAAEASGRRAVELADSRQSLDIPLKETAQGVTIRFALPASARPDEGTTAVIEADGRPIAFAALTSRYVQRYDSATSAVRLAPPPRFWDEVRVLLPTQLRRGTTLTIRSSGPAFAVDLVEAEGVAAPDPGPGNSISVVQFGADPSGRRNSRPAFVRAIAAAQQGGKTLYLDPGMYKVDGHLIVDGVTVVGAGPWHTILRGHHLGFYSHRAGSSRVALSGFAIESDVTQRQDRSPRSAIGGRYSHSRFTDLYLHHANVGIWLDGPADDLVIRGVRIADQAADGINLHRGIHHAVVEDNEIRSSGDDGIASWSDRLANSNILISGNRVTAPRLANGIALYGGRNIEVSNNQIEDTLTEGGGIHLGSRFHSAPFGGWIRIARNSILRSGSMDPHWHFGVGAIWIYALERPITAAISLSDNDIGDPSCEAVQLIGPNRIDGVIISGLKISGRFTSLFALQAPGSLSVERIDIAGAAASAPVEVPADFRLVRSGRNSGWDARPVSQVAPPRCV
jgi:alpha-1,3-glucanase-like protein